MGFEKNKENGGIYGFHGTNNPNSIGKDASNGCIRMKNEDVEEFFELVKEGAIVTIK
jgi:lipoprotein-anchoring transpeptidase ErfK/SrfK